VTRFGTSTRELAKKARADPLERATPDRPSRVASPFFQDS